MKLDTTNRQYVTVKNKVRPKLGLPWGLGRSPKSIMAGFRTWSSYILLDGKFSAHSTLLKNQGLKMIRKNVMQVFLLIYRYQNSFFHKFYHLGAYNECTKNNANISFRCKNNIFSTIS